MSRNENLLNILKELSEDAQFVRQEEVQAVTKLICDAKRIFVAGAGRSGFVARAFSNRLMHLGFTVYFVGEPTTPSIQPEDLLIIGSGSGETTGLVAMAKKAVAKGIKIATLTIFPDHTIGSLASAVIRIPGVTSQTGAEMQKAPSIQPHGSSFEQLCWLIYDSMIVDLKKVMQQSQEQMDARHANLE